MSAHPERNLFAMIEVFKGGLRLIEFAMWREVCSAASGDAQRLNSPALRGFIAQRPVE